MGLATKDTRQANILSHGERMSTRAGLFLLAFGLCAALAAVSCTTDKPREGGVSASELCGRSLDDEAVRSAEKMSGSVSFAERDLPNAEGIAERLRKTQGDFGPFTGNMCRSYVVADENEPVFFEVSFIREVTDYSVSDFVKNGKYGDMLFDTGKYASFGRNGGVIVFPCAGVFPRGQASEITGRIFLPLGYVNDSRDTRASAAILNSISRAVAKELGCLKTAGLPASVPGPSTTWSPDGT